MLTARGKLVIVLVGGVLVVAAVSSLLRQLTPEDSGPKLPTVPEARRPALEAAARTCDRLSVPLLAAQIDAESDWRPDADSGRAQGIAQFTPTTWSEWGRDGNGDGTADVWEPTDAIPSQARYMCHLYKVVADVPGDPTELALAAYNAGPTAVLRARGVPGIHETRSYVADIVHTLLPGYRQSEAERTAKRAAKQTTRSLRAPSAPSAPH